MNNVQEGETCAHGPCECIKPEDEEYCSVYCENADSVAESEIRCSCGHPSCR